ncbi:hypothetical protein EIZ39_23835 [Ammoniphilus sp. CFH 90114]|nr:hypothetical protein EIZ39_23835 [Ammoniphilus sp. CFH 90114]
METVNTDHIVLRGIDPRTVGVKANTKKITLERSGKQQTPEFETVQYYGAGPYSGYYVLPLYTLLALSRTEMSK